MIFTKCDIECTIVFMLGDTPIQAGIVQIKL